MPDKIRILGDYRVFEYPMIVWAMIRLVFVELSMLGVSRRVDVALMCSVGGCGNKTRRLLICVLLSIIFDEFPLKT